FGLRILAALGDAEQIAGRGHDDEELIAPEHEPGEISAEQAGATGALRDIEGTGDQDIAAESEHHARRMQGAQEAEMEPRLKIEIRKGKLRGNGHASEEADNAPEHRGDDAVADRAIEIARRIHRFCRLETGLLQQ